jgi:hypothetical protein
MPELFSSRDNNTRPVAWANRKPAFADLFGKRPARNLSA